MTTEFIAYVVLGLGGMAIIYDGLVSITLYFGKPSWRSAKPQTWKRDHWVRVLRMIIGIAMVVSGWALINS